MDLGQQILSEPYLQPPSKTKRLYLKLFYKIKKKQIYSYANIKIIFKNKKNILF